MLLGAVFGIVAALMVAVFYRPPDGLTQQSGPFHIDLTARELSLSTIAGFVWTFYNVSFVVLLAFGPAYLIASGWGAEPANSVVSIVSWVNIMALPVTAWIAERLARPNMTMIVCFSAAALAIWFVPLSSPSVSEFILIGIIFAPPGGLVMALPGEAARQHRRAITMGVFFTCYYGGMGLLLPIAGYTRDLTGNPAAPLWFAGSLLIVAIMMLLLFRAVQSVNTARSKTYAIGGTQSLPNGRIRY